MIAEYGFSAPAELGMTLEEVQTPCLVIDMSALEHNLKTMADQVVGMGVRLRVHAKAHKSVDIAKLQQVIGGACGICCQKVSEAEVFVRAGFRDVLITNEVRQPSKIDRMARLALGGARVLCCVDDLENVAELSEGASKYGVQIECLVEFDCGGGRCGVKSEDEVLKIAIAIEAARNLKFAGIQAYQGKAQHIQVYSERRDAIAISTAQVAEVKVHLETAGLSCDIVGGGGTGTFAFEGGSGVYNELQCGTYALMDADYNRVESAEGVCQPMFKNALFILTSVMSKTKRGIAVCDAGLKTHAVDSGLPKMFERTDVEFIHCADEHGAINDPQDKLCINDQLLLVPGHCDPTCNLHDFFVCMRDHKVEALWPISARGKLL